MRIILTFTAALAMAAFAWGAGPATAPSQKKAPAKKPSATSTVRKTSAKPATTTSAARKGGKRTPARPKTTWRNRQTSPTNDRYREIQEALVVKGYLTMDEVNGQWSQASADALKKFQADQTIETTGKINSLSLIALGLGPKHDTTVPHPVDGAYPMAEAGRN
jgi:hypothetical protein